MKDYGRIFGFAAILMVVVSIFGCAPSRPPGTVGPADPQVASMENPVEAVQEMGTAIKAARKARVDLLSPDWFERAETAYASASKALSKGKSISGILADLETSRNALSRAQIVAEGARTELADVITARDQAIAAGGAEFEDDFEDVEAAFLGLTGAFEQNKQDRVQKYRNEVRQDYHELEVRGIKASTIGDIDGLIEKADDSGARKLAPISYARAVERLNAADAFIEANPYAEEKIRSEAEAARFEANRLLAITDAAAQFKSAEPEAIALIQEKRLAAITDILGAQDMRNQPVDTQMENIIGTIAALKNDRDFITEKNRTLQAEMEAMRQDYQTRIDALNVRVATLEGQSREDQMAKERMSRERMAAEQRLAAEMRFNKLYQTVQNYFESQEAEVYKQENQLIIRLKAMHFPVGKSIIMPANYTLLSKVQQSIRTFEAPRVVVEGHTDTTGSDEVNMRLSQARADAVRDYLIANQTLAPDRISAIGYGSDRPLASNTTAAGRAINRRIDILIIPQERPI